MNQEFYIEAFTLPKPKATKEPACGTSVFNGRLFHYEKTGGKWEGFFGDNDSVLFVADTKTNLLAEASQEAA